MSEDKKDAQVKVFIGRPGAGQQVVSCKPMKARLKLITWQDPNNLTTPVRFTLEVNQAFGESVEAFEERQGGLEAEFRKMIDIFHRVPENHRAMVCAGSATIGEFLD